MPWTAEWWNRYATAQDRLKLRLMRTGDCYTARLLPVLTLWEFREGRLGRSAEGAVRLIPEGILRHIAATALIGI